MARQPDIFDAYDLAFDEAVRALDYQRKAFDDERRHLRWLTWLFRIAVVVFSGEILAWILDLAVR